MCHLPICQMQKSSLKILRLIAGFLCQHSVHRFRVRHSVPLLVGRNSLTLWIVVFICGENYGQEYKTQCMWMANLQRCFPSTPFILGYLMLYHSGALRLLWLSILFPTSSVFSPGPLSLFRIHAWALLAWGPWNMPFLYFIWPDNCPA